MAKGICFTRLVSLDVTNNCHTILVFFECRVAKLNLQQELQHEYLNSHMFKTLVPLLFTSFHNGRKTNTNGGKMNQRHTTTKDIQKLNSNNSFFHT